MVNTWVVNYLNNLTYHVIFFTYPLRLRVPKVEYCTAVLTNNAVRKSVSAFFQCANRAASNVVEKEMNAAAAEKCHQIYDLFSDKNKIIV